MERFLTYDRLISMHRNKLDVEPFPDDKLNMAYLDNKYNQFMKHLTNSDDDLIRKTTKEIYNQLQNGDEVYKYSIQHPELINQIFNHMLEHGDDTIRVLCSLCFRQFCMVLSTKELLHESGYLKRIGKAFHDKVDEVRTNVYQGLIYYTQSQYGRDTLLKNNILELIIIKLREEKVHEILHLILILLNEILNSETAPQIALSNNIVETLKLYLESEVEETKYNIILNYGSLSLCEEGKKACVEQGK